MPAQKKQVKKVEQTENKPKSFTAFVTSVTERNELVITTKEGATERVILAHVDVPRYFAREDKEEAFAYECGEFLRKRLVGKSVKFEVVTEVPEKPKTVVPTVGSENVVASLIALGYAVIKGDRVRRIEEYANAEAKAKAEKKGIFCENIEKVCKKRPAEAKMTLKEVDFFVGKTLKGFIRRVEAPATFIVETPERKYVRVALSGVHQHAAFSTDNHKYELDVVAKEAVAYVEKVFAMRDCEVKIVENGQKVRGFVTVGDKDVTENLLLNGFVTLAMSGDSELKKKYEAAELKAQNEKKGRYADEDTLKQIREKKEKKEKAVSDRLKNAKIVTGFVKFIGKFLRIEQENGEEVVVSLASVRPVYKKDDAKFNKNVEARMRECIRKQIAGKKVEAKLAYTQTFKRDEKEVKEDFYDVYANGKNVAIQLLREGLVTLDNKTQDVLKQSFDIAQLKSTQTREFKVVPIMDYTPANIANIKDALLDTEAFSCAIEKVISLTKYVVYIPSKEITLTITMKNCKVPKGSDEATAFVDKARDVLTKLILYQDATVKFVDFFKGGLFGDVDVKGVGSVVSFLTEKGYIIPTGKAPVSAEVEEMRTNKLNAFQFETKREAPVKENKEEEERKVKKIAEAKFGAEEKIYMTGYDGEHVYYYLTQEETAFIDAMSEEIKAIKRGKYELKLGKGFAVEIKGKMYRAEVLSMNNGANIVRCVDTGITVVVGKNKIRSIPAEVAEKEVKVLSKKLIAVKPLSVKDACYKVMLEAGAEFCGKVVAMATSNDEAKVVVDDVCLNVHMVEQGLSLVDKRFFGKGEFGAALKAAEEKAKDEHLNAWQYGEIFDEDEKERL